MATMNKVNLNVAYFDYQESLGLVEKLSIDIAKVQLPYLYFLPDVSSKVRYISYFS